ncbi:hypothetical protein MK805_16395 [Shimazuella sp. AN120528]|uniref:hypothetical protein n=1 Tax=Shimazuella soli TaxID=1892854 RepID=UPI001F0FD11B|nr:hypothetical protein [Shimazuella soli]MCH5586521.1 hypothetical protein [Shimazuella soli]
MSTGYIKHLMFVLELVRDAETPQESPVVLPPVTVEAFRLYPAWKFRHGTPIDVIEFDIFRLIKTHIDLAGNNKDDEVSLPVKVVTALRAYDYLKLTGDGLSETQIKVGSAYREAMDLLFKKELQRATERMKE